MVDVQAVVFDLGETLVNESRQWRMWAAWLGIPDHVLLAALGAVIERGEHHHRVFDLLRPGFNLKAARAQRMEAGIPDEFEAADLYPDVSVCLYALHARGLRIGIAGNQPAGVERILGDLGLPVDFMASSALWNVEKPSPGFFQKIVDELKVGPASIAYVRGRLDNDILPARAAGLFTVFIRRGPWGLLHARRPEAAEAHLRIESLSELPDALGETGSSLWISAPQRIEKPSGPSGNA
jgi:FMN phosphatase YigB (HAD superfamily)